MSNSVANTFTFNNAADDTHNQATVVNGFLGFISDTPFTSISVEITTTGTDNWGLDNIQYSFAVNGGVSQDPHFVTPNGVKFDFNGQPDAAYSVFSAPSFAVNMQLMHGGPAARFMNGVAVKVGNVTIVVHPHTDLRALAKSVSADLSTVGATVKASKVAMNVMPCPGHTIGISTHHTAPSYYNLTDNHTVNYLDVKVSTSGCSDTFGGALGQTFVCKFVKGVEQFVWSHDVEESFRVSSLTTFERELVAHSCNEQVGASVVGSTAHPMSK